MVSYWLLAGGVVGVLCSCGSENLTERERSTHLLCIRIAKIGSAASIMNNFSYHG
jgi:hypothetical protein